MSETKITYTTIVCPLCEDDEIMTYEDGVLISDICMGGCFKLPIDEDSYHGCVRDLGENHE